MNAAKIQLSPDELELVENASWILTKNRIMGKVYALFGMIAEHMKSELTKNVPLDASMQTTPKISKGENYQGLPYVILDYPRLFSKEDVFAIRTMFWWANYFSVTLHLKGSYKEMFIGKIGKNISGTPVNDFYISISGDEWMHELDEKNYIQLSQTNSATLENIFSGNSFLKISTKIELNKWNDSEVLLMDSYKKLLRLLDH
jgi:hypothetical protein